RFKGPGDQQTYTGDFIGLLRVHPERPSCHSAADEGDEFAPFHRLPEARITAQYSRSEPCIAAKAACSCPSRVISGHDIRKSSCLLYVWKRTFGSAPACRLRANSGHSIRQLGLRKFPVSVQDFEAWFVEPDHVVPAGHRRQAIRNFTVAPAELDRDRTVRAFFGGDIVDRIRVVFVLFKPAIRIVKRDLPKTIDWNVTHY